MPEEEIKPEINLGLPAFIPADYMPDEHQRLVTYKRISWQSPKKNFLNSGEN